MEKEETVFADGLIFKLKDNQPDFVIGNISVKVEDFVKFLNAHSDNGWVNIQVLKSQAGKPYAKLDTWKPKQAQDSASEQEVRTQESNQLGDSLPF